MHDHYGTHGAVDRLVEWAWSPEDKIHIDDESIRLCATALSWFLTTSNRFLRDRTTKALVALLTPRIHILTQVISQFIDINDLYVLERLFAVAYGCAMRSTNDQAITELAKDVYRWIFENGEPIPHILLRDYARGVIEVALHRNANLEMDVSRIRPPYKSEWFSHIPSKQELEEYWKQKSSTSEYQDRAVDAIHSSVLGWGDFARYIIGTNSHFFEWSSLRLDEPIVIPYLNSPHEDENLFDLSIAQRWIFWKVFDLGWTVERFSDFDSIVSYRDGRESKKAERIGKKYQWLAYHEFLARVSDNFVFKGDEWNENDKGYDGSWQLSVRDIDPSCLLKSTKAEAWYGCSQGWWFPLTYDAWNAIPENVEWLKTKSDLPSVESLIELVNPKDNSRCLLLENYSSWNEPTPVEKSQFGISRRSIRYTLKSYILHKDDMECLYNWAIQQDFMESWMPESHELHKVFLGEFFGSSAFEYHNIPYFHHDGWTQGSKDEIPKAVLVSTDDQYLKENTEFDCSVDDYYRIYLPCQWLVEQMNLRWNGVEGCFFDERGELIAFDPSVREVGSNACLI